MKKITFLMTIFFLAITSVFAQEGLTLTGVVTDDTGIPLPGANVMVKNTTTGTVTNFDGEFELVTNTTEGTLEISYVGYISQEFAFSAASKNFNAVLASNSLGLKEVMIISSRAIDRKTPVAVSTIKKEELQMKLGNQEFVEILKSTPGVFVNQQGGGFGDAELTMRGFNSENVAVLINGIPVNDMEDGRVFWSNWAGLGNVSSSVQVQRGLGASKVAVPSIGGTMNTITETTDAEKGGLFTFSLGNNNNIKYGAKLSTGLTEKGFAATIYVDRTTGDGFVDGTPFESISYFGSISKKFNDKHKLVLNAIGTQQKHGTRFTRQTLATIESADNDRGIKYNADWGIRNGEVFSLSSNFYNKPLVSLNHYWNINDNNMLSTSVYASRGEGGVQFDVGNDSGNQDSKEYRFGSDFGPVNVDKIVEDNVALGNAESGVVLQANRNNHNWLGALSSLNSSLSDVFDLTTGVDYRYYRGQHYREITDLLGGSYYLDDADVNSTNDRKIVGDKYGFNNDGIVQWAGFFSQLEYDYNNVSAFVAANVSNTAYQRIDYFNILDSEDQSTDWINFLGYGIKGGANYRLDEYHNVFTNIGYFERAPFFDAVFPTDRNDEINEDAINQKIFSAELGYGLRMEYLSLNFNLYRTSWKDRTEVYTIDAADSQSGERGFANVPGVDALHQGFEMDFKVTPTEELTITGMLSYGDWNWKTESTVINILDPNQQLTDVRLINLDDVPVGRSAQTTAALGLSYKVLPNTTINIDYNYYGRFYANFDIDGRSVSLGNDIELINDNELLVQEVADALEGSSFVDPWKIPDYFLFDLSLQHKFKIGSLDATLNANLNNVFNEEYLTFANDSNGQASEALVHYGRGRTFNVGTVINF